MSWKSEWKVLALIVGAFAVFYDLPMGSSRFEGAILEALHLGQVVRGGARAAVSGPDVLHRRRVSCNGEVECSTAPLRGHLSGQSTVTFDRRS